MFIKPYVTAFLSTLILGTIIALSANSWLTAWLGLEINLIRIIPLLLTNQNNKATERAIKYFLPQAIASVILIASFIIRYISSSFLLFSGESLLISASLIIKLGVAPFHLWFPQVLITAPWFQAFLILTWQKIAPFILIIHFNGGELIFIAILASGIVGALGGLNQTNVKLILTYSSIAHSGWLLTLSSLSLKFWVNYFLIYSLNTLILVFLIKNFKINNLKQLNIARINPIQKYSVLVTVLSLGGLPPFLGFYAKLSTIIILLNHSILIILLILLTSSLISLFYYLKMIYNLLIINSLEPKIKISTTNIKESYTLPAICFGVAIRPALILLT